MSNLQFRPSVPNDVTKAVPLIFASGPDAFNYVFKNDKNSSEDFLSYAFIRKGGEFSYDNHYAVTIEGEVIGIGSAFTGKGAKTFTFVDALNIIKFYKLKAIPILMSGLKIERIIQLPEKNEISLAHIAINPYHRSKGYGEELISFLMERHKSASGASFILDVSELNPRAKNLYEQIGFVVTRHNLSKLKSKYGSVVNHYRMEKENQ